MENWIPVVNIGFLMQDINIYLRKKNKVPGGILQVKQSVKLFLF